jgi:hypothetical protein
MLLRGAGLPEAGGATWQSRGQCIAVVNNRWLPQSLSQRLITKKNNYHEKIKITDANDHRRLCGRPEW